MPEKQKFEHDEAGKKFIAECKGLGTEIEKLRTDLRERVKAFFSERINFIFAKCPAVKSVSWVQYTPGFCDGDPCTFHSQHEYCSINTTECEGKEWEEGTSPEEQEEAEGLLDAFMGAFDSDDMQDMFGDPVRVTVTPAGIDIDDYDCGY